MQHIRPSTHICLLLLGTCLLLPANWGHAATQPFSSDVLSYNLRLGSQGFDGNYQFTTNKINIESARHLLRMGSDIVKLRLHPKPDKQSTYSTLVEAANNYPEYTRILDMPFRHYFFWTGSALKDGDWWKRGPHAEHEKETYTEMYELTKNMLTRYNNSGKKFYFGNWEGDWLLMGTGNTPEKRNPTQEAIEGMTAWLNARQSGVDDATRDTPHQNVAVFFYVEINRVRDAMRTQTACTNRLVNTVLPRIKNLDYVSYSSYDAQSLNDAEFVKTMNYIEAHICTNKNSKLSGKRLFIGEYGFGSKTPEEQLEPTRTYMMRALRWGVPFMLFWQVYNNEPNRHFCLVDEQGADTPCFLLHADSLVRARREVAHFKEKLGRLPTDHEYTAILLNILEQQANNPHFQTRIPPQKTVK
ncbi:MAG: hypothetical protein WCJ02_05695 [bacterium]